MFMKKPTNANAIKNFDPVSVRPKGHDHRGRRAEQRTGEPRQGFLEGAYAGSLSSRQKRPGTG